MRGGTGADIADERNVGSGPDVPLGRLEPGRVVGAAPITRQQPLRRHLEAAAIALGLVRAEIAPAGIFGALVSAISGNRNAHRLGGEARRFEMSLARIA